MTRVSSLERRSVWEFPILQDNQFMEKELAHLEKSALETLAERDETLKFLAEYNKVL